MTIKQLNINVIQDGYTLSIPQILKKKMQKARKERNWENRELNNKSKI